MSAKLQIQAPLLRMIRGGMSDAPKKPGGGDAKTARVTPSLDDQVLVQRAAAGDQIAFSELVTRHYERALRVAFGLLRDTSDAEDVIQEAFARVYVRLSAFEGGSAFYTWLYRIVVNLSIDQMRRRRRERRGDLGAGIDTERVVQSLQHDAQLWPKHDRTHPGQNAERSELGQKLSLALADLPPIHQAVLLLREVEGQSYEEIATTLQIKKGTVMSRLFHARRGMQLRLATMQAQEPRAQSEESA